jgi:hypothetical protein
MNPTKMQDASLKAFALPVGGFALDDDAYRLSLFHRSHRVGVFGFALQKLSVDADKFVVRLQTGGFGFGRRFPDLSVGKKRQVEFSGSRAADTIEIGKMDSQRRDDEKKYQSQRNI